MLASIGIHTETARRSTKAAGATEFMILDVKRAHFYARAIREVYITMPKEDPSFDVADPTAVLLQSLDGTQDAAANWEAQYASTVEQLGFVRARSCHACSAANPSAS